MKKTTKIALGLAVIAIIFILIILGVNNNSNQDNVIKMGYIGPITGPSAVLGMDAIKSIEMAVDETNAKGGVNGRKIQLIVEDDKYLSKDTVNAYNKLVNVDKVKIILISTYGGVFAVADQAKADGVVIIDPLDCNKDLASASKNIFCIATETESIGTSLAQNLSNNGGKKAAVMYSTKDSFMSIVANAFDSEFSKNGGITMKEGFNYDDTDYRAQLLKIKEYNPDALIILGHDEQGFIMKQARELGIKAKFMTTGTITSPVAQQNANGAAEGALLAYWDSAKNNSNVKDFETKFIQKVGRPAILPLTTHPAYDTVKVLTDVVLPKISGNVTGNKVSAELLKVSNYQGITGTITIDKDGGARIKESVYKLVKGNPVSL
jgi:branched-chain amino acid transport system substrate-binding protein